MARAGRNAKEIMIPMISVTGLDDYTRNVGYKTGSIDFSYETKAFNYATIASYEGVSVTEADISKAKATDVLGPALP